MPQGAIRRLKIFMVLKIKNEQPIPQPLRPSIKQTKTLHLQDQTMKTLYAILIVTVALTGTVGCSMCCGPYDFDYPVYGGKFQRADPAYGRVGSILSDPNAGYGGPGADSNLAEAPPIRVPDSDEPDIEKGDDDDLEKFKRELESISPSTNGNGADELPEPDQDPTASRMWKNRPLRPGAQWR